MTHPIIQRHVDEAARVRAEVLGVVALLNRVANDMPRECGFVETGMKCACTGACHPKEYFALQAAINSLCAAVDEKGGT